MIDKNEAFRTEVKKYYDIFNDAQLHLILNEAQGIFYARITGHPFWPSRVCTLNEYFRMLQFRQKEDQLCVFFLGSESYGWVNLNNGIHSFLKDLPANKKLHKKYTSKPYKLGMELAAELKQLRSTDSKKYTDKINEERICLDVSKLRKCLFCGGASHSSTMLVCSASNCLNGYDGACIPKEIHKTVGSVWRCPSCAISDPEKTLSSELPKAAPPKKRSRVEEEVEVKTQGPITTTIEKFDNSEEICVLCGYGGEVIVCDHFGCTKVYHQLCLGTYPVPINDHAEWFCPRHTCAVSSKKENTTSPNVGASPKNGNELWKCIKCPVAISNEYMSEVLYRKMKSVAPASLADLFSKKERLFLCPNCALPGPRVQLSSILEKIWALLATNRQGLPFYATVLPGVKRSISDRDSLDLAKIQIRIRTLQYDRISEFVEDIKLMAVSGRRIISGKSKPLDEALDTLEMILDEQVSRWEKKVSVLERSIPKRTMEQKEKSKESRVTSEYGGWYLPWRCESMPFGEKTFARVECRNLSEWEYYICNSLENMKRDEGDLHCDSAMVNRVDGEGSELTSYEQKDIAMILSSLEANSSAVNQIDDEEEGFLSPSTEEMKQMLEQQSIMLRKVIEGHSMIRNTWQLSREAMFCGGNDENVITLGEGRLAAEAQVANRNLRERLKRKNVQLGKLSEDHQELLRQLAEAKAIIESKDIEIRNLRSKIDRQEPPGLVSSKRPSRNSLPSSQVMLQSKENGVI